METTWRRHDIHLISKHIQLPHETTHDQPPKQHCKEHSTYISKLQHRSRLQIHIFTLDLITNLVNSLRNKLGFVLPVRAQSTNEILKGALPHSSQVVLNEGLSSLSAPIGVERCELRCEREPRRMLDTSEYPDASAFSDSVLGLSPSF